MFRTLFHSMNRKKGSIYTVMDTIKIQLLIVQGDIFEFSLVLKKKDFYF